MLTIDETRVPDVEEAHKAALQEADVREKCPTTEGWLVSNHQYAFRAHRVAVKEMRGSAGTLFNLYRVALCGAKIGGAWGKAWSKELPPSYEACPKCERAAAVRAKAEAKS